MGCTAFYYGFYACSRTASFLSCVVETVLVLVKDCAGIVSNSLCELTSPACMGRWAAAWRGASQHRMAARREAAVQQCCAGT